MKLPSMKYAALTVATTLICLMIALLPFHAFLTVWGSSLFGHYTELRLWKEALLVVLALAASFLLLTDHKIRSHTLSRRLVWVVLAYCLLVTIWGTANYIAGNVTPKAYGFGMIINLRFPVFFLLTWAVALRTVRLTKRSRKLILWPAAIVIVFGLLQALLLPHDFLRHFGYSPETIRPFQTINSNLDYIRITSTLRGANPLGAYLLIPISLLVALLVERRRNWYQGALLAGALVVLYFSFSRAAWIGAVLSIAVILAVRLRSVLLRKEFLIAGGVLLALIIGSGFMIKGNARLENIVLHTESNSKVKTNSNEDHFNATTEALEDVAEDPLGDGIGSAGSASVYNDTPRIPENYYLQIGQEAGWLGLILFLLFNVGVGLLLWIRRHDPLALALFASLIGISAVNMFSQAWSDDTLAYVWWGLAGIAMVNAPLKAKKGNERKV